MARGLYDNEVIDTAQHHPARDRGRPRGVALHGARTMPKTPRPPRTWGQSHSVRLADFDYREHVPYHVTVGTPRGTTPFTNCRLAPMVCKSLWRLCDEYRAYLGAYCLIPDHLHILLSPDRSGMTLGDIVGRIQGTTTNESWKLGWKGPLWQKRFYDHIVRKRGHRRSRALHLREPRPEGTPCRLPVSLRGSRVSMM